MFSKCIHVVSVSFFLWLSGIPFHGYATLCIRLPTDVFLGYFHLLATVISAAVNMSAQVSV